VTGPSSPVGPPKNLTIRSYSPSEVSGDPHPIRADSEAVSESFYRARRRFTGWPYHRSVAGEPSIHHSIHYVRVQTPTRLLSFPWESAQEFLARCIAAYPTVHPLVEQFRAVGVSRPVDLTDLGDRAFALGVIEGWAAQVGEDELPPGISELASALRLA
jgi:hypothetical protein